MAIPQRVKDAVKQAIEDIDPENQRIFEDRDIIFYIENKIRSDPADELLESAQVGVNFQQMFFGIKKWIITDYVNSQFL